MSISSVARRGFGYSIGFVARAGYNSTAGVADVPAPPAAVVVTGDGDFVSWQDEVKAAYEKRHLEQGIRQEKQKLAKVEKKLKTLEKKLKVQRTEGILSNYLELELKRDEIKANIKGLELKLVPIELFIEGWRESEIDDDDEEVMLLDS